MRKRTGRRCALRTIIVAILLLITTNLQSVTAQQNITAAALSGRIEDANGAVVNGAIIAVINIDTNQTQTDTSDREGRYRFAYLQAGTYDLKVEQKGFSVINRRLTVSIGQALSLTLQLGVANVAAQVEVINETPLVETARTQVAETVLPREISNLPLNGRNYLDLALLLPGVSRTNTGSVQRFAETSAVPGTGISVAGQRNLNNSFIIDGLSANDDAADLTGTFYSQEVIREFQVVTSGGVAEFGRASSGFVNIITQSGTNDWHGKFYGFLRNQRLDARNPVVTTGKDKLTQTQYGASLGGPLQSDKTFLFANFEQTRRNDTNVITIPQATVDRINNRLNQVNFSGPRIETGGVPGGFDVTNFFTRVDHRLSAKNTLAVTYALYDINATNSRTVGGLNTVSRGTNLDNQDHTINVSNITTLSTRSLNEFRFQYRRSRLEAPVNDETGPAVNINGFASFGTATFSPLARNINLYEASDNISIVRGNHSLKAGVDVLYNRVDIFFPGAFQGVYTFTSLNNFLSNNYSQFQQAFGAPSQFQSNPNIGFFVQDEWKPRTDLTLNLGLRYDAQFLPEPIQTDGNNFAPRIGVAYSPGDHKTVVRANYGIYFERLPLRATSNALQRDGSKYVAIQLGPTSPGAPVFPNVLSAVPSTLLAKPAVTRIDPEIANSYSQQANLQIERELPFKSSVSVGYIHLRGLHLIMSRNVNVPRCAALVNPNLCRPDTNFGNISRFESSGDSYYNGLVFAFNKRTGTWSSLRASYTYSKAIDNAGNFFFSSPQNNFNLRDDRGLSDNDQRHRFTLSGNLESPRNGDGPFLRRAMNGFQLSYIFSYASRLPFNILAGNDRNGDTNFNDRPAGVGRNTGRGFDFASFDLRLSRKIALTERVGLEVIAEGFNLFNRANYQVLNNVLSSPTFGNPVAANDSRQIQFGLRLNF